MKTELRRRGALALALLLALQLSQPALAVSSGSGAGTVTIRTAQDLAELSRLCALDSWSAGKTVVLAADISLAQVEFSPIPSFSGTFDGAGHTVSGLTLTGYQSPAGLFGVVEKDGVVRDLNVSGAVAPAGRGDTAGGVAGENHGLLLNCTFTGSVAGGNSVGGVAGVNGPSGTVQDCTAAGSVSGKSMTGGIVGKNAGTVLSCVNSSYVNITSVDPGVNISDLDLERSTQLFTLRSMDTVNVATDTGGVAGYSSGMLLSCTNTGVVGYPHIGYNVGGIAGRSCGHVARCVNEGEVFGRKDIGGIVGQAEPDIILDLSQDRLEQLREELSRLEAMVDRAADDSQSVTDRVAACFSAIGDTSSDATGYVHTLTDYLSDYGGSVVDEFDRGSAILSEALDRLDAIETEALSRSLTGGLDLLEAALRELENLDAPLEDTMDHLSASLDSLHGASGQLETGLTHLSNGLADLERAVAIQDEAAIRRALETVRAGGDEIAQAAGEISGEMQVISQALGDIADVLGGLDDPGWDDIDTIMDSISGSLDQIADAFAGVGSAFDKFSSGMSAIQSGLSAAGDQIVLNSSQFSSAMSEFRSGLDSLRSALIDLGGASDSMQRALDGAKDVSGLTSRTLDLFADAIGKFSDVSGQGGTVLTQLEDLADYLAGVDPIQLGHPDGAAGEAADALYDCMDALSVQLEELNDAMTGSSGTLADDIRAINGQLNRIAQLMIDAVYETENGSAGDLFSDTSQEDVDAVTSGRVLSCANRAAVTGDLCVGGIAGSMAVEHELDPEDDLLTDDSSVYRREYQLKAILQSCTNTGEITARRDQAGGICGGMDLGLILGCEGGGVIRSENGDCVGGVAGTAAGAIRQSYGRCRLEGRRYVGGIVGCADGNGTVTGCCALVEIAAWEQYAGVVAGGAGGTFRDNLFVSDTLAGIDQVSVDGQAQPVTYDRLLQVEGLPEDFRSFTLRFRSEDGTAAEYAFHYGDSFGADSYPDMPERPGYFVRWDRTDLQNLRFDTDVTALYIPCITALASEDRREDGRAVWLAQGQFQEGDALLVRPEEAEDRLTGVTWGTPLNARGLLERWALSIPDDGQSVHAVHYLSPSGRNGELEVYALENGNWRRVETELFGSYLKFDLTGNETEVAIAARTARWQLWAGIGAAALAVLAAVLLWRRRRKKTASPAPAGMPGEQPPARPDRKLKRVLTVLAVLAALAAGGTVWFFASGMNNTAAAYALVRQRWGQEELAMDLNVQVEAAEGRLNVDTRLTRTTLDGRPLLLAEQYGAALYYYDGKLWLENGCVLDANESGTVPDYAALLEQLSTLFRSARLSVFEGGGEKIYTVTLTGEAARTMLQSLLPDWERYLSQLGGLEVSLVEREHRLTALRLTASAGDTVRITAALSIDENGQPPELPPAVTGLLRTGEGAQAVSAEALARLLTAWFELNGADPLAARLTLSANCGPLLLDDQLELCRTTVDGVQVNCVSKNGRTLYLSNGSAWNEDGEGVSTAGNGFDSAAGLPELAFRLCVTEALSVREEDGAYVFTLELDEEGMAAVAHEILPQSEELERTFTAGSVRVTVDGAGIRTVEMRCRGTVQILSAQVPISISGTLEAEPSQTADAVPEEVLSAIQRSAGR